MGSPEKTTLTPVKGIRGPALRVLLYLLVARQQGRRVSYRSIQRAMGWTSNGCTRVSNIVQQLAKAGLVRKTAGVNASVMPCCSLILREESLPEGILLDAGAGAAILGDAS